MATMKIAYKDSRFNIVHRREDASCISISGCQEHVLPDLFENMPKLTKVTIYSGELRNITILCKYNITALVLYCRKVDVRAVRYMKSLTTLTVCTIDGETLELTSLKRLTVSGLCNVNIVNSIPPSLTTASFSNLDGEYQEGSFDAVRKNTTLTKLLVKRTSTLEFVKKFTSLVYLKVDHVNDLSLKVLKGHPRLGELILARIDTNLYLPPSLGVLQLRDSHITDLSFLNYTSSLKKITIMKCEINCSLIPIWSLKRLYMLGITDTADMESIDGIEVLQNLTRLRLNGTGVTDIEKLSSLKSLQQLSIGRTNITDISCLRDLPKIQTFTPPPVVLCGLRWLFGIKRINFVHTTITTNAYNESREMISVDVDVSPIMRSQSGESLQQRFEEIDYIDESIGSRTKSVPALNFS